MRPHMVMHCVSTALSYGCLPCKQVLLQATAAQAPAGAGIAVQLACHGALPVVKQHVLSLKRHVWHVWRDASRITVYHIASRRSELAVLA